MQVTQSNDFISHAVIGGMAPINFSISNSAEFFHILSSTLYSDQILAVVREVLCNAWDAHIAAGCTDKPIQITIKDNKLTIKDSGHGIDPDDMGDLYATYGGTNKKNDGNQTGGFGLGCKAPFAYTEHFEVQSCHKGVKTIYNISRSCAKVMGIPSIIPIVSLPTEDTGLQVTITLQTKDINRFTELVNRITYEGEMFATLNGNQLKTLGFVPEGDNNYLAFPYTHTLYHNRGKISIRYGNVIYPITTKPKEIETEFDQIVTQLSELSNNMGYALLIQAPANSISVTPSRESLSMQEHTVNTLKKLFINFLNTVHSNVTMQQIKYVNNRIIELVDRRDIPQLLQKSASLLVRGGNHTNKITTIEQWAKQSVNANYNYSKPYAVLSIQERINQLKLILPLSTKLLDSVTDHTNECNRTWLNKQVLSPLVKKIMKNPLLSYKQLFTSPVNTNYHGDTIPLKKATAKIKLDPEERLPYLRNIIFLSTSAKLSTNQVHDELKERNLGIYLGFCFYHLSRKVAEANAARQFFKESGMIVIDLTEKRAVKIKGTKVEKNNPTPKYKGVPVISGLIDTTDSIKISRRFNTTVKRIEKPEFVLCCSKKDEYFLESWPQYQSNLIAKYFGHRGAVVSTTNQYETYIRNGAKPLDTFLATELVKYVKNCKAIWDFQPHNKSLDNLSNKEREVIHTILGNRALASTYGIVDERTEKDKELHSLLKDLHRNFMYSVENPEVNALFKSLNDIKYSEEITYLIKKIKDNPSVELISVAHFNSIFSKRNPNHHLQALAFNMMQLVLNH